MMIADSDVVAVLQLSPVDRHAVDESAVAAVVIDQCGLIVFAAERAMFARYCLVADAELDRATSNPNPFTLNDADDAASAFRAVGLSPDPFSGWSEPAIGFAGTDTEFGSGETTSSGCNVTNIVATLDTRLSGFRTADLDQATQLTPRSDEHTSARHPLR